MMQNDESEMDIYEISSTDDGPIKEEGETSESEDEFWVPPQKKISSSCESLCFGFSENDNKLTNCGTYKVLSERFRELFPEENTSSGEKPPWYKEKLQKKIFSPYVGDFDCYKCSKKFSSLYHLINHIKYTHLKKFEHVCTVCKRAYRNKFILKRHRCKGIKSK